MRSARTVDSRPELRDMSGPAVRAAQLSERDRGYPRPPYVPRTLVNRTGPAVYAALDDASHTEFETQAQRQSLPPAGRQALDVLRLTWVGD